MTRDQVLKVASALFLIKVIGHERILAAKFPSLAAWRKAKWHFWVVQGGLLGHLWAAMGAKDLQRGTSRWFMWAQGRLLGHPGGQGRPTLRPGDAKGEPRDAIGRPRRAKGGPREAKMARQEHPGGTKMGPKWTWSSSKHKM